MKTTIIILALIISSLVGFGQQNKHYSTVEEIDNAIPDSVYRISIDCKEKATPDLSKYSSYKNIISIDFNNFGENAIPEWLFKFENLKEIALTGSKMYKKENSGYSSPLNNLNGISKFKNLERLSIGWTNITELPDELFELQNLKFLFIAGSKISSISKILDYTAKRKKSIGLEWYYEQITSKEEIKYLKKFESGSTSSTGAIPKTSYRAYYLSK
jgi:hypothetical protein